MHRRAFLHSLAATLAVPPVLAQPRRGQAPLGFSTLGCPAWDWIPILDFAMKHGFASIELRGIQKAMRSDRAAGVQPRPDSTVEEGAGRPWAARLLPRRLGADARDRAGRAEGTNGGGTAVHRPRRGAGRAVRASLRRQTGHDARRAGAGARRVRPRRVGALRRRPRRRGHHRIARRLRHLAVAEGAARARRVTARQRYSGTRTTRLPRGRRNRNRRSPSSVDTSVTRISRTLAPARRTGSTCSPEKATFPSSVRCSFSRRQATKAITRLNGKSAGTRRSRNRTWRFRISRASCASSSVRQP